MSNLMLDVDQAGELKAAFRRGDWTNAQIKKLCESDLLEKLLLVLENKAEIVMKKAEQAKVVVEPLLTLVKTIFVPGESSKKTAHCFFNKSRYCSRDGDLDGWLPENQPAQPESTFLIQRLSRPATFKQVVEKFLGTGETNIKTLSCLLRDRGYVTTLPAIETLIDRQESHDYVGLDTGAWGNFFFVRNKNEKDDEEGSVSVVLADRGLRQWEIHVYRLGSDCGWVGEYRFFFRQAL